MRLLWFNKNHYYRNHQRENVFIYMFVLYHRNKILYHVVSRYKYFNLILKSQKRSLPPETLIKYHTT